MVMSPPPFVNCMQARVNVKMCLSMMVRVHTNSSPSYVSSLATPCSSLQSRRALRSSSQTDYVVTRSVTKFGDRSFVFTMYYTRLNASSCRTSFASLSLCKTNFKTYFFVQHLLGLDFLLLRALCKMLFV